MSRGTVEAASPKNPGSLLGTSEVVELLGVPRSTVARWLRENRMPRPVDVLNATPVWRRTDIERFRLKREAARRNGRR